ncbi:hypothetical protein KIP88_14320 [Bradyrhizobium sp. SRL28]|uniref:hypothetical protein n=1 Tax=Bradyrhizobium sp. SRL28 TaxID=2836178 RepID=UPI001BDE4A40|nr:hypothetical protein [Bradyrhizobium sp. SRL28]MBT1511684.1 hypothetical protein [Bradyrhizobium sp. SRL28]
MRFAAAAIISLISVAVFSGAFAQEAECSVISAHDASMLQRCGDRLSSFSLELIEREATSDFHGRIAFNCPIEPMCEGEPTVGGFFVSSATWQKSAKDEQSILETLRSAPAFAALPLPLPTVTCPPFDVSIGDMTGRGICLSFPEDAKAAAIVMVVADGNVGILLHFYQQDNSANRLRGKVDELLSQSRVVRAAGDAGLMRWIR